MFSLGSPFGEPRFAGRLDGVRFDIGLEIGEVVPDGAADLHVAGTAVLSPHVSKGLGLESEDFGGFDVGNEP
jgi:hypothetical protein